MKIFYESGDLRGIQAKHAQRLRDILDLLDAAEEVAAVNVPGLMLHLLEPKNMKIYAVKVSGNWRVTFRVASRGFEIVNYLDYHQNKRCCHDSSQ